MPDLLPTSYPLPAEDRTLRAHHDEVEDAIRRPACTLLDVRSEAEYLGERFWPSGGMEEGGRAGHVPGAQLNPIDGLYDERGAFRRPQDLAGILNPAVATDGGLITYCTIGSRAATAWFVLTYLLGRSRVRVYDGSWAEWGRMPAKPVEAQP